MDSCAYKQTLEFYKKDIEHFKQIGVDLIFQQDNSPSHVSPEIRKTLSILTRILMMELLIFLYFTQLLSGFAKCG